MICEDCGLRFSHMTDAICGRCRQLTNADGNDTLISDLKKKPQCIGCGTVYRNLANATCAACEERESALDSGSKSYSTLSDMIRRRQDEAAKMKLTEKEDSGHTSLTPRFGHSAVRTAVHSGTILTDPTLSILEQRAQAYKRKGGKKTEKSFYIVVITSIQTKKDLGLDKKARYIEADIHENPHAFEEGQDIADLYEVFLESGRRVWHEKHASQLDHGDLVILTMGRDKPGVPILSPPTLFQTVGDFFTKHSADNYGTTYVTSKDKHNKTMHFKVLIVKLEDEGSGDTALYSLTNFPNSLTRKRVASVTSLRSFGGNGPTPPKTLKTAAEELRRKLPSSSLYSGHRMTCTVSLEEIGEDLDNTEGALSYSMSSTRELIKVFTPVFAKGATKRVYKAEFETCDPGASYVAKEIFKTGRDKRELTPEEHLTLLKKELARTEWAREVVKRFELEIQERALSQRSLALRLADCFIFLQESRSASFLCELLVPMAHFIKVCGPVGRVEGRAGLSETGLIAVTVTAFQHFSYYVTGETAVLVDVQGHYLNNEVASHVQAPLQIFDVMWHTLSGNSGVGDLGPVGIEDFCTCHKCNELCGELGLAPFAVEGSKEGTSEE